MQTTTFAASLSALAAQKMALYCRVQALSGTIEDKYEQLVADTIANDYLQMNRAYFHLAATAPEAATQLEALKRLIFLAWCSFNEPSIFTGLDYYDPNLTRDSYTLLESYLAATAPLDSELYWMLSHYAAFWGGGLLPALTGLPLPVLSTFIMARNPAIYLAPERQLPPGAMSNRGQMGLYWQSLGVEHTL